MTTTNPAGTLEAAPLAVGWTASRWERALHDRRTTGLLGVAERQIADAVLEEVREYLPEGVSAEVAREQIRSGAEALGRGLYGRLYGAPVEADSGPAWARSAATAIAQGGGLEDLRSATSGDPDMAAIAASTLIRGLS